MRIFAACQKCIAPDKPPVWMTGEIDNDLLAVCACPNGHRYLVHQAHSVPEIVYSAGVRAFLAGFYSESVVTLAAALERGYELFTKVFLRAGNRSTSDIEKFWSNLRNSSERQLGSFCATYYLATGTQWKSPSKQAEFRNKVAHQGYIATREEAHVYGDYVTVSLNAIMSSIESYNQDVFYRHLEESRAAVYRRAEQLGREDPSLELCFAGSSAIAWHNGSPPRLTFSEALETTSSYLKQFSG